MNNRSKYKNSKKAKAFSLVELSIVILVIGILVAAIAKGKDLLKQIKVAAAQSLTSSSVVNSVENLTFWFETSDPNSFLKDENVNGNFITKWLDRNPQKKYKNHAYGGQRSNSNNFYYNPTSGNTSGPEYIEDGIAGLPTLRFDNTGTNYRYVVVDPNGTNQPNKSFMIFFVLKYRGGSGYLIDRSCINQNKFAVQCSAAVTKGMPIFNLNINASKNITIALRNLAGQISGFVNIGKTLIDNEILIIAFERDYNKRIVTYINGQESVNDSLENLGSFILSDPFKIGIHAQSDEELNTDISEIIFFNDKVLPNKRKAIEKYLSQKYSIKINH